MDLPTKDEDTLATSLVNQGPISVAINATMGLQLYKTGVFNGGMIFKFSSDLTKLNHGVLVVGYGSDQGD